jgi:endonuclease YncB( thermonuclease family)
MTGTLKVKGTIDLTQFWPTGSSDADTTKIKVTVARNSFSFATDGKTFKPSSALIGAFSVGTGRRAVIDAKNRITVRLQGIDAPELHFKAPALRRRSDVDDVKRAAFNRANKAERRQHWAETATIALSAKLATFGEGIIPCTMLSLVDYPYEAVDTYGRLVGTIEVQGVELNRWLVSEGWAFPTFYSSMSNDEIEGLRMAMRMGRRKRRIWPSYSIDVNAFDETLIYRGAGADPDPAADRGPVLMPKLFRRQVAYRIERAARITRRPFADYLQRSPDSCFMTDDFLENGVHSAETRYLSEFVEDGTFTLEPHELVFREKPSSVVDAQGNRIEVF